MVKHSDEDYKVRSSCKLYADFHYMGENTDCLHHKAQPVSSCIAK